MWRKKGKPIKQGVKNKKGAKTRKKQGGPKAKQHKGGKSQKNMAGPTPNKQWVLFRRGPSYVFWLWPLLFFRFWPRHVFVGFWLLLYFQPLVLSASLYFSIILQAKFIILPGLSRQTPLVLNPAAGQIEACQNHVNTWQCN